MLPFGSFTCSIEVPESELPHVCRWKATAPHVVSMQVSDTPDSEAVVAFHSCRTRLMTYAVNS